MSNVGMGRVLAHKGDPFDAGAAGGAPTLTILRVWEVAGVARRCCFGMVYEPHAGKPMV